MKFDRLKITGFKTFVDPTDVPINPGLTGIVGPNGCGKSNLVEALRWVMGETSHKSMRASGMDDVIFSGSGSRPSRNVAEVRLIVDNAEKLAPAAFNDAESLEISRRIEREEGSTYRINGREVRARDVQLLFADAASGARSPSLVRQGQIGEIIAAKPQARRRILEDAAGIAGLHSRRHEAELKLKAAEDNLVRVEDVLRELNSQIESLNRQAKQAEKYQVLAAEIRRLEALAAYLQLGEAKAGLDQMARQQELDVRVVADALSAQGETARVFGIADHAMEPLRLEEAKQGAALQRLTLARDALDGEEARIRARISELEARLEELQRDSDREAQLALDAGKALDSLAYEQNALTAADAGQADLREDGEAALIEADAALEKSEQSLADGQGALAELNARRAAAQAAVRDAAQRAARAEAQKLDIDRQLQSVNAALSGGADMIALRDRAAEGTAAVQAAEAEAQQAEQAHRAAREASDKQRPKLGDAERASQRLETEARTLKKFLDTGGGDLWPPVVDSMKAAKGYEIALGAALGDDLEASAEASAPVHWALLDSDGDPVLPNGIEPLSRYVEAPPQLQRRLKQIGIVTRGDGPGLRRLLKPGQRLVSTQGDLWRWDGLTQAAEAPSPAARRLAGKNQLGDIEKAGAEAAEALEFLRKEAEHLQAQMRHAAQEESRLRDSAREARRHADSARETLAAQERKSAENEARLAALTESRERLSASFEEALSFRSAADAAFAGFAPDTELAGAVHAHRADVSSRRAAAAEARASVQGLRREAEQRAGRLETVAREIAAWAERRDRAAAQGEALKSRRKSAAAERDALSETPAEIAQKRRALAAEIEAAEQAVRQASDRRAEAETARSAAEKAARAAVEALSAAREARARSEALAEAARQRLEELGRSIVEALDTGLEALPEIAGIEEGMALPPLGKAEEKLSGLKRDRERIGPVNLRAEDELKEVETKRDRLVSERDDLTQAIGKLRQGIRSLSDEGRERLKEAFIEVNGHFQKLFTTLFGGGTAELQLIESDDPLEAGLEIMVKPPGKKPTVMTLLSGGEQALTATALIFAVFLTNPSPVCVLDEIDAPLDDHNVERLCDLLDEMVKGTETRFVIITHNPITMSRMDRLFGVTMAERGVSQLVSVDLEAAGQLIAAE